MEREQLVGARLVRVGDGNGMVRVGLVAGERVLLWDERTALDVLTTSELPDPVDSIQIGERLDPEDGWRLLAPLVPPETWAAGVTYERSRDARIEESEVADVYDLVYGAERPELFMKDAAGRRTVGPGQPIAARADATWTVPEPELALVLGADGTPLAVTIGNDVSSRDIEGANPLYLPQAKIYGGACALGPALFVPEDWGAPFEIELRVVGEDGAPVFEGHTTTASMRRSLDELIDFLFRDNPVPAGSVLLTGTGIVPPEGLEAGQTVEITIPEIGTLRNPVSAERSR